MGNWISSYQDLEPAYSRLPFHYSTRESDQKDDLESSGSVSSYVTKIEEGMIIRYDLTVRSGKVLAWQGIWNPERTYFEGDLVQHNEKKYLCLQRDTSAEPTDDGDWTIF